MTSYRDWVVETSSTTGTGAYALSGSPPAGTSYFTFRQRFSNGEDEVVYWVVNADRTKWEKNRFGTLTYGSPDTLSRNVVESTNGDAPVSWSGGDLPLRVYVVPDSAAQELSISMGLGASRPGILKFGLWVDLDDISAGIHRIKLFDGASDINFASIDTAAHDLILDPTLSGWRRLGTANPSGASSVDFTGIPSSINHIMCLWRLRPGTDNVDIQLQTYGADGILDTGVSDYYYLNWVISTDDSTDVQRATGSSGILAAGVDNSTDTPRGRFEASGIQDALFAKFTHQTAFIDQAGSLARAVSGTVARATGERITGLRLKASGGTVSGVVDLFGAE